MMAVKYHGCTCHQRYGGGGGNNQNGGANGGNSNGGGATPSMYSAVSPGNKDGSYSRFIPCANGSNGGHHGQGEMLRAAAGGGGDADEDGGSEEGDDRDDGSGKWPAQPWYFHVVASAILVVHGFTFLVPHDPDSEDTDMVRTVAGWLGYDLDWVKHFTPYAQGLASVFNISLGIVSCWTAKGSERYTRLIQLRVFAFCINILHAYITGPIVYQSEEVPLMSAGRIIGLFRLSYLTPGLMAAGVTEVIVDKEESAKREEEEEEEAAAAAAIEEKKESGGGGHGGHGGKSRAEERRRKK